MNVRYYYGNTDCAANAMHSFFLTFRDSSMERAFDKSQILSVHRDADIVYFFISTIVFSTVALKNAHEKNLAFLPSVPYLLCAILVFFFWYVYVRSSVDKLISIRPIMAVSLRILAAIAGAISSYFMTWQFQLDASFPLTVLQFLVATESFGNLPYVFGLRMKFKQHLLVQIIAYGIFLLGKAPQLCIKAMTSPGAQNLTRIGAIFDYVFELLFSFLCMTIDEYPIPEAVQKVSCLHVTNFMMTFFSMVVVSYVLWRLERYSRIQFLRTQRIEIKQQDFDALLVDCLILIALASVYWHYSTFITNTLV